MSHAEPFWIFDFGFWIKMRERLFFQSKIQNLKSKIHPVVVWLTLLCCLGADKPIVAVFPLGGTSDQALRDRIGFSIRAKLDRDGTYSPLDGFAMKDMASAAKDPLSADTSPDAIKDLATDSGAVVLIWGDCSPAAGGQGDSLRLRVLDLRSSPVKVGSYDKPIADPEQVRFVVEKFLQTLPGIAPFEHPNENPVQHDPASDAEFRRNPNLVVDGDFTSAGHWDALLAADKYPVQISDQLPDEDKVCIYQMPVGNGKHNVLAMNLSRGTAESYGVACLSEPIEIEPGIKYRVHFRYRSDGPSLHVFVKGYTRGKDIAGNPADLEIYRLQVPPSGATNGQWQTVEADLNPSSAATVLSQAENRTVQRLRVDLYAYLKPGTVFFDDVELKSVGIEASSTRPVVP